MKNKKKGNKDLSIALKIGTDLVGSGIVGTVLGVILDKMLETAPIFLIICLILSLIAAAKLIYKYIK